MIRKSHSKLSIEKQCQAMSIAKSSFYYKPKGESKLNLELMKLIDEHYLEHPEKGAARMHTWLTLDKGFQVSRNRIDRLYYDVMGLRAILPGPHTSKRCKDHPVYPYLLRDKKITASNQVWAMDITYIGIETGFMYLCAIIDLHSRFVVGWSLSNTMDASWCAQVLEDAIEEYGCPEIINTDQGSQFTSNEFTTKVFSFEGLKLSMDGKGRATDNAFIERLWRSVKYEKLYLYKPQYAQEAYMLLVEYFDYYNNERRHSSIENLKPKEVYLNYSKLSTKKSILSHYNTHQNNENFEVLKYGKMASVF